MSSSLKIVCVASVILVRSAASPNAELSTVAARFEEPLVATGRTSAEENAALLAAVKAYEARETADDFAALHSFLTDYPRSNWRIRVAHQPRPFYYHYGCAGLRPLAGWMNLRQAAKANTVHLRTLTHFL